MAAWAPDDGTLRALLEDAHVVAVVGLSSDPERHSNEVGRYLQEAGYRVIPVNPNETSVLGEQAFGSLLDVPERVDVVDVFRRSEFTPDVAREAVAVGARVLWMQTGVVNEEAARIAEEGGLEVVMGLCIMSTHDRLEV